MNQTSHDHPVLVAQGGLLDGRRWILEKSILIGREQDCDICIPNRQVSRHHALFKANSQGVWIEDLNSKNGTHLNGKPVNEATLLDDGDVVQISLAQQFVYLSSDATISLDADFEISEYSKHMPGGARLKLDKRSRRVWIGEIEILPPLSVSQFNLLEVLYRYNGEVVSRPEIINAVYDDESAIAVSDQALDALVRRLRDRLAEFDFSHQYVVTIRGHGLRLDNQ